MIFKIAGRFIFDPENHTLTDCDNGESVLSVARNESRLLHILVDNQGEVMCRADILKFVWEDHGLRVDNSSLSQAVSLLRKTLGESSDSSTFIVTVPRLGYRFVAPVEPVPISGEGIKARINHLISKIKPDTGKLKWHWYIWSMIPLLVLGVLLLRLPPSVKYSVIDKFDGIPVKVLEGSIIGESRLEPIRRCISSHLARQNNAVLPDEVIVVSVMKHKLALNYIYSKKHSENNFTVHLVASSDPHSELCHATEQYTKQDSTP